MSETRESKVAYLNQSVICNCGWVMFPHPDNFQRGFAWLVKCTNERCPDFDKWWEVQPYLVMLARKEERNDDSCATG